MRTWSVTTGKEAAPYCQDVTLDVGVGSDASPARADDLSREVYCILGVPVDAVGISSVLRSIETAAVGKKPFFLSTPNLNFLVNSQLDSDFRESLLMSDMCLPDGMPILGIARLIGVPIRTRIPGSDIFDALKCARTSAKPLKIFLFGGPEDAAATASRALNAEAGGLYCVGSLYPGFGSVDEMSRGDIIDDINASGADFLVASLGARKGQSWLQRNHHRFLIPVRAHLGATLNFQAGTVRRAPSIMQRYGLEWLWRIKEEPYLWRRYWHDGKALLRLLFSRVLPLAIRLWWLRLGYQRGGQDLVVTWAPGHGSVTVSLSGFAVARHVDRIVSVFRDALATKKRMFVDLSETCAIDARFLGLLLMVRKQLTASGVGLIFIGLSPALESIFRLNGLGFLLVSQESA